MKMKAFSLILLLSLGQASAQEECVEEKNLVDKISVSILENPETVFPTLKDAIQAQTQFKKPAKQIKTSLASIPEFPSYSECKLSFFRVATIGKNTDQTISKEGWKSGWLRRKDELQRTVASIDNSLFDGLPPTEPMAKRVIEYVRVKNIPSNFPKHSTIVGIMEDPIRTLSVGYHTGYNSSFNGSHMRLDEIEVGSCAKAPACKKLVAVNSSKVFSDNNLISRYSTEGEWAVDTYIPPECIVATYRITFQKVDDKCYSDSNSNCNF